MIRRPPRSTLDRSSAASDVYKRQVRTVFGPVTAAPQTVGRAELRRPHDERGETVAVAGQALVLQIAQVGQRVDAMLQLSLIHISEPTRPY